MIAGAALPFMIAETALHALVMLHPRCTCQVGGRKGIRGTGEREVNACASINSRQCSFQVKYAGEFSVREEFRGMMQNVIPMQKRGTCVCNDDIAPASRRDL